MDDKTRNALNALAVIIKTDHIRTYLTQNDPQALKQATAAFYAFEEEHLKEATIASMERIGGSSRVPQEENG